MAVATSFPASTADTTDVQRRRVGWSAFLGTTIEYYDFTLYGLMGPIVFGKLFFPQSDPSTALIAVLAIYAVGFFGRPLGGLVFSHYGDRLGRKPMMIISMSIMGLASTLMGLLPSYASIGVWAPILLLALRVIQGFALGGESAGANVLSTEVAPYGRRGFFTSLVTSGIFVAWLLAVAASTAVSYLSADDVLAWGWRLPFLASFLLVAIGMWMRIKIEESAVFVKALNRKAPARIPFIELLQTNWKPLVIVLLAAAAESASGFFFLVFGFSYAVAQLKIPAATLLQSLLIGNTIGLILAPMFGALSDRIGRRRTLSAAYIIAAIYTATAFFPMLESGNTLLIYLAMIFPVAIVSPLSIGVIGSFYSEQFADARLRYSGVGVGRGLGTTLGGGLMPVIATGLMAMTGGSRIGPIVWFGIVCIAGTVAILLARETKDEKLA
jgi:MFS transporter, MHS family, shikimate and dehydroshikimate transport protein